MFVLSKQFQFSRCSYSDSVTFFPLKIRITLKSDIPVQVDGEPWIQSPCSITVLRSALKVAIIQINVLITIYLITITEGIKPFLVTNIPKQITLRKYQTNIKEPCTIIDTLYQLSIRQL